MIQKKVEDLNHMGSELLQIVGNASQAARKFGKKNHLDTPEEDTRLHAEFDEAVVSTWSYAIFQVYSDEAVGSNPSKRT